MSTFPYYSTKLRKKARVTINISEKMNDENNNSNCSICKLQFANAAICQIHKNLVHPTPKEIDLKRRLPEQVQQSKRKIDPKRRLPEKVQQSKKEEKPTKSLFFLCEICGQSFRLSFALQQHSKKCQKAAYEKRNGLTTCPLCKGTFINHVDTIPGFSLDHFFLYDFFYF